MNRYNSRNTTSLNFASAWPSELILQVEILHQDEEATFIWTRSDQKFLDSVLNGRNLASKFLCLSSSNAGSDYGTRNVACTAKSSLGGNKNIGHVLRDKH